MSKPELREVTRLQLIALKAGFQLGMNLNKKKFDKTGVSEQEIQSVLEKCSAQYDDEGLRDRAVDICFKYADTNGDGVISKEEC